MLIRDVVGFLLIVASIFDALKYSIQAHKIHQVKTAKAISRRFINWALMNDIVKLFYGCSIFDLYIILSSILALICMLHLWVTIYIYYPYRMRGCLNFKRPSIFRYLINSLLPNSLRKKL